MVTELHSHCPPLLISLVREAVVVLRASLPVVTLPPAPCYRLGEGVEVAVRVMNRDRWPPVVEAAEEDCEKPVAGQPALERFAVPP